MKNQSVIEMWGKYKQNEDIKKDTYTAWHFGSNNMADRLGKLVVSGDKKATIG